MSTSLVLIWAAVAAFVWWEAEQAGLPRNIAIRWTFIVFLLGPFGAAAYVLARRGLIRQYTGTPATSTPTTQAGSIAGAARSEPSLPQPLKWAVVSLLFLGAALVSVVVLALFVGNL